MLSGDQDRPDPLGSNTHSVCAFLMHPLSASVHPTPQATVWSCLSEIKDGNTFTLKSKPMHTPSNHHFLLAIRTYTWLRRRGIQIHAICRGVLDIRNKCLYMVELVGERNGRVVLGVVYCSPRRGQGWDANEAFARRIASVAKANYRINPDVAILNVYGDGRVKGRILEA